VYTIIIATICLAALIQYVKKDYKFTFILSTVGLAILLVSIYVGEKLNHIKL
jgi:C4-dicarboxylate transporter